MQYNRYGSEDGLLNELLKIVSGGHWEFVWAQQYFSMTDQLNLGSRYLMLDPVYFWGAMRLCHCGTNFKWVDKVIDFIEKVKLQFQSTVDWETVRKFCRIHVPPSW